MTVPMPSLLDRVSEVEDQVVQVYDWTHQADERLEQQRNRLDFLAQGIQDVKANLHSISHAVDKLDAMVGELLALTRPV